MLFQAALSLKQFIFTQMFFELLVCHFFFFFRYGFFHICKVTFFSIIFIKSILQFCKFLQELVSCSIIKIVKLIIWVFKIIRVFAIKSFVLFVCHFQLFNVFIKLCLKLFVTANNFINTHIYPALIRTNFYIVILPRWMWWFWWKELQQFYHFFGRYYGRRKLRYEIFTLESRKLRCQLFCHNFISNCRLHFLKCVLL